MSSAFFNGYHWCSEIRKISNVPVIFISPASANKNIVMAMNMSGVLTAVFAIPVIVFALPLYVIIKSADRLIKIIEKP